MDGHRCFLKCGLLSLLLLAAPAQAQEAAAVSRELPPAARLESRQALYAEKLTRWREVNERTATPPLAAHRPAEWGGCMAAVEDLVRNYGRLREEAAGRVDTVPALPAWQVFSDDIAFLEGGCNQLYQQLLTLAGGPGPHPAQPAHPEPGGPSRPLSEQEQLDKWNRALGLLESGNFDEAIGEFSGLLHGPQATAARDRIREAQTQAAAQLRRQAAALLSGKGDDPAQRRKHLEEAWLLLNRIPAAYPEATILDKVRQNLIQIENQLNQLDPAVLPRLKGGGPG